MVIKNMKHKSDDVDHTLWYVGETTRPAEIRVGEKYAEFLKIFGVTCEFQVSQTVEAIPFHTRLVKAPIGGCIQGATSRTLQRGSSSPEDFIPKSFAAMSSVNLVHCGDLVWIFYWLPGLSLV